MDAVYAGVSSEGQDLRRQVDELEAAGCDRIVEEKASGRHGAKRPKWTELIDADGGQLRQGDRLSVVELSRLGRSTTQLTALLRDLIAERTRSALDAKRRRGERIGGRKPTHTPQQVARAMEFLDATNMTGQEVANVLGMSRSRMYALVARRRAELEELSRVQASN